MAHPLIPARQGTIWASRAIVVFTTVSSLGSFFWHPATPLQAVLDIVVRAYLLFVAGGMAHEATHGHLGNSRSANLWWGRLALLPTTVPYGIFRKTHLHHHLHTNVPDRDPDLFLDAGPRWQRPVRALLMPHNWMLWLLRNRKFKAADWVDYLLTYAVYLALYGAIISQVGAVRFIVGLIPATILHAYLLWYPFAIMTHEGYSTGSSASRSHNYYGALAYWLSFGLSLHRVHHEMPQLGWLQMHAHIPAGTLAQSVTFRRDIHLDLEPAG
jgi:fatty acid desaturase